MVWCCFFVCIILRGVWGCSVGCGLGKLEVVLEVRIFIMFSKILGCNGCFEFLDIFYKVFGYEVFFLFLLLYVFLVGFLLVFCFLESFYLFSLRVSYWFFWGLLEVLVGVLVVWKIKLFELGVKVLNWEFVFLDIVFFLFNLNLEKCK